MPTAGLLLPKPLPFIPTLEGEVEVVVEAFHRQGRMTGEQAAAARAEKERIMTTDPAWLGDAAKAPDSTPA